MAVRTILLLGDPLLYAVATKVPHEELEDLKQVVQDLHDTLLDFRKHGDSPKVGASLKAALAENKFVPSYLLGRKRIPRNLPDHYGFGDDAEAVIYAYGNKAAWHSTPGALEWLSAQLK